MILRISVSVNIMKTCKPIWTVIAHLRDLSLVSISHSTKYAYNYDYQTLATIFTETRIKYVDVFSSIVQHKHSIETHN